MELDEKLTQARKAAGLTQADVAAKLNVSRQAVSRWESGVSHMLLDIGVQCSVEVLEFGSYISRTTAGEHDMAYFGWTTSSGDADYTYYSLEHSTQQGAAGNRSFIADPDLDALIEEARSNTDESKRKDLYKDIAIMLAEINNNIPVFYSAINVGANKKVEGFVMDSNGYHNLNQVKVAQ